MTEGLQSTLKSSIYLKRFSRTTTATTNNNDNDDDNNSDMKMESNNELDMRIFDRSIYFILNSLIQTFA